MDATRVDDPILRDEEIYKLPPDPEQGVPGAYRLDRRLETGDRYCGRRAWDDDGYPGRDYSTDDDPG